MGDVSYAECETEEPQLNSSGNSPQDYTTEYVQWRKNRETHQGKAIFKKFGLNLETARRLDLGVTGEGPKEKRRYWIICPVTESFYIKIAPEPAVASGKDISIQNSFGSTVIPCNLGVFDSTPDCVFVTTDVRDMLAIEQFGFRAVALNQNNNNSKKKLLKKIRDSKYNGAVGLFYSNEKTYSKMNEIKSEIEQIGIKVDVFTLDGGNGTFYEGLKKNPNDVAEVLFRFCKKYARGGATKPKEAPKIIARLEPKAQIVPAPKAISSSLEIQPYEDAFEALPDHSFASEHDEMAKLIEFIEEVLPEPHLFIRIPNELARDHQEGWKFKEEGLRAGVPDYFYAFPCGRYSGLWIEMKREDGGEVSHAQQQYLDLLSKMNYMTAVCHGVEEAKKTIIKYLANRE